MKTRFHGAIEYQNINLKKFFNSHVKHRNFKTINGKI